MNKNQSKRLIAFALLLSMCILMTACGAAKSSNKADYTIGLCNYVDDASLNQIVDSIKARLDEIANEKNVSIELIYDNCNADASVMEQIISQFLADKVDLMIGVATPVAMRMQAATEEGSVPVVFSAVSDPVGTGLVDTLQAPGANITGTSDYLDTDAIMKLILALKPDAKLIGLLYDPGQDASTTPIASAKAFLDEHGVKYIERTGTTTDEIMLAAQALAADKVDAVFTPTDNTVMTAELAIYETFIEAGIPHFTGADSFALNGAFLGYGVDYSMLGTETANMAAKLLFDGAAPATTPVMTFDNGTATINVETCAALGLDYSELEKAFAPFCSRIQSITTAESFEDLNK